MSGSITSSTIRCGLEVARPRRAPRGRCRRTRRRSPGSAGPSRSTSTMFGSSSTTSTRCGFGLVVMDPIVEPRTLEVPGSQEHGGPESPSLSRLPGFRMGRLSARAPTLCAHDLHSVAAPLPRIAPPRARARRCVRSLRLPASRARPACSCSRRAEPVGADAATAGPTSTTARPCARWPRAGTPSSTARSTQRA